MASAAAPEPVLRCSGLRKAFGDLVAVGGVGFTIAPGETFGLLGPNGAGKTTTISICCGLLQADDGEVTVSGRPVSPEAVEARAAIGYVPQDLAIYPDLTGRENLRFFARLYGLSRAAARERADAVLDLVGLAERAGDRAETYSGGMKRRLNIALGLLHEPRLLVLDEPTVGVDPQSRNAIVGSVERLGEAGLAVLYTTHYMEEAERLCDRVAIMDHGVILAEGTRRELVSLVGERDRVRLDATGDLRAAATAVLAVDGVRGASESEGHLEVITEDAGHALPAILAAVGGAGAAVTGVQVSEPNLEAVFLHVTGRAMRD